MKNTLYPLKALLTRSTDPREAARTVAAARAYVNDLVQEVELKIKNERARYPDRTVSINAERLLGVR